MGEMKPTAGKTKISSGKEPGYSGIPPSLMDDFMRVVKAQEPYHLRFDADGYVIIDQDTPQHIIDWLAEG
jgi:hypothetical protein